MESTYFLEIIVFTVINILYKNSKVFFSLKKDSLWTLLCAFFYKSIINYQSFLSS